MTKNKVHLEHLYGKWWATTKEIVVTLTDGNEITIPKGFVTDLSSVPKFLWGIFPPYGDFLLASLIHDWMYIKDYRREELGDYKAQLLADKEMLYWSNWINRKHWWDRIDNYVRYFAVRLFGYTLYHKWENLKKLNNETNR